jgi:hypothetical protein
MSHIELYCTVLGAIAVILGGVWLIVKRIYDAGKNSQRFNDIEENILDSYMKIIAILIRDRFFKEQGINIFEIDIYDPDIPTI